MAASANIYKTASYIDPYSKDGVMTDPIFKYPPNTFDGEDGESKDIELFLKNDGDTKLASSAEFNLTITPIDVVGSDESTWAKLATTQGGLDSAIAGYPLYPADLEPEDEYPFWLRITVPASTPEEDKQDLRLRIRANSIPV